MQTIEEMPENEEVKEDGDATVKNMMWTDIYKPKSITDLVGNDGVVN
jgi:hypothetical protein